MMDTFEYFKNDGRTNNLAWLREIPFITYGYVKEVIDNTNVVVIPVVQDQSTAVQEVNVTLLTLSSALYELQVVPQENDLVLMLSLDKINTGMFNRPDVRKAFLEEQAAENEEESEEDAEEIIPTLPDLTKVGYTLNSMVGILLSTKKSSAATITVMDTDGETPRTEYATGAGISATYNNFINMVFRGIDDEELGIHAVVEKQQPVSLDIRSSSASRHGFLFNPEESKEEASEAPITREYSPLADITETFGGPVDRTYGVTAFKAEEEGEPAESEPEDTEGPVSEYFSETAPYTLKRAGTTTHRYGFNAEDEPTAGIVEEYFSEDTTVERTYENTVTEHYKKNVSCDYEEDLELTSKGAFKGTFEKSFTLAFKEAINFSTDADITLESTASGLITIGNTVATLGALVEEIMDILDNFDTVGSPAAHQTGPGAKAKIAAFKPKWGQVFK